jgi:prepilin-type N-terminal cleavage/methylation domain-containing protein
MRRAFTLIELVVAVALLAMVVSFSGVIFKVSIESHRGAKANAEVMQKLRAITDQLNNDFTGLQKDAPWAIQFSKKGNKRYDSIVFLSSGDFQSIRQYRYTTSTGESLKTVCGNVASVYYGQAGNDPNILARKQKILTYDGTLIDSPPLIDPDEFLIDSLAEWKVRPYNEYFGAWIINISVDPSLEKFIPLYLTNGISDFTIEWAEYSGGTYIWKPIDTDFISRDSNKDGDFGFTFNIPGGVSAVDWYEWSGSYPRALKFSFTLRDSKGVMKQGRRFTHIVYIGE